MKTLLDSTRKLLKGWIDSSPIEAMQASSSSLSPSVDLTISRLWERWIPIVSLRISAGQHGAECRILDCLCGGKHSSVESVRQSHRDCVQRLLQAGVQVHVIKKYNLDSPVVKEMEREEWIEIFMQRQLTNKEIYAKKAKSTKASKDEQRG